MVLVAEVLADLTLLKMINAADAAVLVSPADAPKESAKEESGDLDFDRAVEFLALSSKQQEHAALHANVVEVDDVIRRLTEGDTPSGPKKSRKSLGSGVRMAGSWAAV